MCGQKSQASWIEDANDPGSTYIITQRWTEDGQRGLLVDDTSDDTSILVYNEEGDTSYWESHETLIAEFKAKYPLEKAPDATKQPVFITAETKLGDTVVQGRTLLEWFSESLSNELVVLGSGDPHVHPDLEKMNFDDKIEKDHFFLAFFLSMTPSERDDIFRMASIVKHTEMQAGLMGLGVLLPSLPGETEE